MRPYEVIRSVVVVLAFKTVYTLEQKRRDNDKKVVSLFVGMKDMMGALLLCVAPSIQTDHTDILQPQGAGE